VACSARVEQVGALHVSAAKIISPMHPAMSGAGRLHLVSAAAMRNRPRLGQDPSHFTLSMEVGHASCQATQMPDCNRAEWRQMDLVRSWQGGADAEVGLASVMSARESGNQRSHDAHVRWIVGKYPS
jgi:hypothetical protein